MAKRHRAPARRIAARHCTAPPNKVLGYTRADHTAQANTAQAYTTVDHTTERYTVGSYNPVEPEYMTVDLPNSEPGYTSVDLPNSEPGCKTVGRKRLEVERTALSPTTEEDCPPTTILASHTGPTPGH